MDQAASGFDGRFAENCQKESVPACLQAFTSAVLRASSATDTNNEYFKQASLTISQLLQFNTTVCIRANSSSEYHSSSREPPLPIYIAQMLHLKTRNLSIIEKLSSLGICISRRRLQNISISMGNTMISAHKKEGVVLPRNLRTGIFSTASVDNIDVNTKSSTVHTSLHGTAASINQHLTEGHKGTKRDIPTEPTKSGAKLSLLPEWYTEVSLVNIQQESVVDLTIPEYSLKPTPTEILADELWLQDPSCPSWSVFHSKEAQKVNVVDISVMLPIWRDDSKSIATIKHVINVIIRSIDFLNSGQPAVIGFDQPLYAIAKALQWKYLSLHGPEKLIVMLGPLHIEMAVLSCLGDILEKSGWTTALANANITSTGNEFLLSGHSVAKTKYAHKLQFSHSLN